MTQKDDEFWQSKLQEMSRDQLVSVQKAAAGWSTLFTAVLAVFGSLTFSGALFGFDELDGSIGDQIKGLATAAVVAAIIATVFSGIAANTFPKRRFDQTAKGLKKSTSERARNALICLWIAMGAGVVAAGIVTYASLVVVWNEDAGDTSTPTILAIVDGRAVCGELKRGSDGTLQIGDAHLNDRVTSTSVVTACPE